MRRDRKARLAQLVVVRRQRAPVHCDRDKLQIFAIEFQRGRLLPGREGETRAHLGRLRVELEIKPHGLEGEGIGAVVAQALGRGVGSRQFSGHSYDIPN